MMKRIQTSLTRNTFFLVSIVYFLALSAISHGVTIELSEAPSSLSTLSLKVSFIDFSVIL